MIDEINVEDNYYLYINMNNVSLNMITRLMFKDDIYINSFRSRVIIFKKCILIISNLRPRFDS
jgi:hypothetical protein